MYEDALYDNFGIERIPLSKLEDMMKAKPSNRHFMRLPFYDILTKKEYLRAFEFSMVAIAHHYSDEGDDHLNLGRVNSSFSLDFKSRTIRSQLSTVKTHRRDSSLINETKSNKSH